MYIKIENYRRFSIFVLSPIKSPRIYLYRNGFGNARKKIESFVLLYRDIGILSFSASLPSLFSLSPSLTLRRPHARTHIPALYFLFYTRFSLGARKRKREKERARDTVAQTHPQFEYCRGLIGSYRAVMSHNGADNARDNTPPACF